MGLLERVASRMPGYSELRPLMDAVESRQTTARELTAALYRERGRGLKVLDLGCGEGASLEWFEQLDATVEWNGVDIEGSPEVLARMNHDGRMKTFDGVHIPFPSGQFDIVYCHQVLEHVRRPYELLAEVSRVLKGGGIFVGSVSYLEPYHSYSVFNFTPYGLKLVLESAALAPVTIRHSADVFYKILRQMLGGSAFWSRLSSLSLIYGLISLIGWMSASEKRDINLLKNQYAGALCFVARKPI
jgi:ubiquinone/menaquinone biosynthesis C-methylase UbiE